MGKDQPNDTLTTDLPLAVHELNLLLEVSRELLRHVSDKSRYAIINQIKSSIREEKRSTMGD